MTKRIDNNLGRVIATVLALGVVSSGLPWSPASATHGTDTQAPSAVPNLTLETEAHDGVYVNEVPNWAWDPASDDGEIGHYDVRENDPSGEEQIFQVAPDVLSYEPRDPWDGHYCVEVRAVDEAGNEGPWTDASCAFLDRIEPEHVFGQPRPATLHLDGPQVLDVHPMPTVPADRAYVLGGIDVYLNSTDPGDRTSGLDEAFIEQASGCSDPRLCGDGVQHACDNAIGPPAVCLWEDADEDTDDPQVRDLTGITTDRANNTARQATVTYTRVDLATVERPTDDGTTGVVHWEDAEREGFERYEVYAALTDGDSLVQPVRRVAVVEDRDRLRAVDEVPEAGETWTYVVATYTEGLSGATELEEVTHPTELTYAEDEGRVSRPVRCAVNQLCLLG